MTQPLGAIAALYRYPVKSMLGEELTSVDVTEKGIVGDRAYALLDVDSGRIASVHHPDKWAALLQCTARTGDAGVGVTLPDGETLPVGERLEQRLSELCGRTVRFIEQAPDGAQYEFQLADVPDTAPADFVAFTLSLAGVRSGVVGRLPVGMQAPPGSLVDVAPVHVITTSSLRAVAGGGGDGDVRRFRPNVVVDTGEASGYVEREIAGDVVTGDVELTLTMPTMRCLVPTLEQAGGVARHRETLAVLARDNLLQVGPGKWACLGHYATVRAGGQLRVGAAVLHRDAGATT